MFRGDRLKDLREARHLTHQELADLLSVGYAQIYRFEAGKVDPGGDVLARIADLFKVSIDYLMDKTDDPIPYLKVDNLSSEEREVISAMRNGNRMEAIRIIAKDN